MARDRDHDSFDRDQDPMLRSGSVVEVPHLLESGRAILRTDPESDSKTSEDESGIKGEKRQLGTHLLAQAQGHTAIKLDFARLTSRFDASASPLIYTPFTFPF